MLQPRASSILSARAIKRSSRLSVLVCVCVCVCVCVFTQEKKEWERRDETRVDRHLAHRRHRETRFEFENVKPKGLI